MNVELCRSALKGFANKKVLVVGDLMLDEHIWGTAGRISPEAPVMVVQVESSESDCRPGGAANVANNIRAYGAHASVVGIVGEDEGGRMLLAALNKAGVDTSGIFVDKNRPTTRKTRIWASHRHQVVRVDWENRRKVSAVIANKIIDYVANLLSDYDAILISDYDKGIVTREIVSSAVRLAKEKGVISASNPKPRNISCYTGIGVMTLNQSEAETAAGMEFDSLGDVEKAGRKLLSITGCGGLVITRGAHGLSTFSASGDIAHIPAMETEVYDVAGAGDTVVSALTLALSCGLDIASAGAIANCAGGAVVRKVGVATTSVDEVGSLIAAK